ncbi:SOS response-associated peptidase [Clostridium sp. Marseille-P3244]|uniref:SOS response-associated peptidase n=1 Tax=Clostridium sp. Marseille-P3244 TaxID=1871020 RepID=UPI000931BD2B|nr:SOS response-associated peptidase [Clostridium sp. Marseille-P3244]
MCGRYYVDEEMAGEIERLVRSLDKSIWPARRRDVFPSQNALILRSRGEGLSAEQMRWGFPGYNDRGLLINARAESALERKTFRECIRSRRCVIPARGFYEWNREKEKFRFERKTGGTLFLAGCFEEGKDRDCFVVLTTAANPSVLPVHDRMPLVLEKQEIDDWLLDDRAAETLLHKTPGLLKAKADYEQMRFPFV